MPYLYNIFIRQHTTRGFNGSVNIPESCDLRSYFDPLNIFFLHFFINTFLLAYAFCMYKRKCIKEKNP